jgi:hypothetical protein
MPSHAPHTDDQLRGGARDFCGVLDQVPLAFVWESYFSRAFATSSVRPNVKGALRNAAIESSLLNIRLLNDFFAPRHYDTDIRAEDYVGYASPGQFLDQAQARELNKHIAHLTTEHAAAAAPMQWSIYYMICRAHDRAVTFIRFLRSPQAQQYRPPDMDLDSRIQTCDRIESDMRRFLNQSSQPLAVAMTSSQHVYEVRPRKNRRGVDLISDALPFGRLWYDGPNAVRNAIGYASHYSRSRSRGAVVRVYDDVGNVIETHEHPGEFKEAS